MEVFKVCLIIAFASLGCVLARDYEVRYITDCASARLCCEQVNNTCFVPNARKLDGEVGNCYCDAKCLQMNDCCVDFETTCKGGMSRKCASGQRTTGTHYTPHGITHYCNEDLSRDCQMGEWTEWSTCSNTCGRGRQHRKRAVEQEAAFGGKRCPTATRAKRVCNGDSGCLQQSVEYSREEMMEVGYIMPLNFSTYRISKDYSPQHDIRKNLFFKNFQDNIIPRKPVYSAVYKITHAGRACKGNAWAQVLEKGSEVCVECQPTSMNKKLERCRGHGVFRQETTWKAIEARNCHGKWKMLTHHQSNTCNHQGDHDFVLV